MSQLYKIKSYFSLLLLFFLLVSAPGAAAPPPFLFTGEVIFERSDSEGSEIRGQILLKIDIAPDHYLYAGQLKVNPLDAQGIRFGEVLIPKSIPKDDPYLGPVGIFKEQVQIRLPFQMDKGTESVTDEIGLLVRYQGCTDTTCFLPAEKTMVVSLSGELAGGGDSAVPEAFSSPLMGGGDRVEAMGPVEAPSADDENLFARTAARFGFWGALVAVFFWGFLASLTPCVYPMIPITMSVIGAKSAGSTRRGFLLSLLYVLGLSLTYAIFGVAAAWTGGLFGAAAGHPAVRILIAVLFLILALGMFDLYYVQMPSAITRRIGTERGSGAFGVFLTGAASGLVVGPCVGPMLVAVLVYIAALGSKLMGFLIMWSFALGLGMLFLVVGTFSGALTALPGSGKWMVHLKNLFGVLMLAGALYFIEPVLPQPIFYLVLGIFLVGVGIFMRGLDPPNPDWTGAQRLLKTGGIVLITIGIVFSARFALWDRSALWEMGRYSTEAAPMISAADQKIPWLADEAEALAQAAALDRPVMIDFRADWCAACLRMERETFPDPRVARALEAFVPLKIDSTDPSDPEVRRLSKKYGVVGLPTIVFLDAEGLPLPGKRITQFLPPARFLQRLPAIGEAE